MSTKIIDNFSLGTAQDPRERDTRYAQLIKNFDAHTFKHKLVPFRSSEDGNANGDTDRIRNFAVALQTGTTYSVYGLGRISASDEGPEVFRKDLTTGAANDLDDADWVSVATGTTGSAPDYNLFVYYRKTGRLYGARAGTNIWSVLLSGPTYTASDVALTYTHIGQGLVHSKDDILYIPYYNNAGAAGAKSFIAKNNNGSWTTTALTLPDHLIPVSVAEYEDQLAIACRPASGVGESVVYLWDRDETATVLSKAIPWGEGNLTILENIEGFLVGVSYTGVFNATADTAFKPKAVLRYYAGSKPITFLELVNETQFDNDPNDIPLFKQKVNNYLYFVMKITLNGTIHHGVWKVGRTKAGTFSLVFDRSFNNDVAPVAADEVFGFHLVGDYMFIAYNDGGTFGISKTDNTNLHDITAIYETVILNGGDSSKNKQIKSVGVMAEPLPANGQITLLYKANEETSFTTIFVWNTNNEIYHEAVNIESSGAEFPTFREITFRIEAVGQTAATTGDPAVPTGIKFVWEDYKDNPSD